MGWGRCHCLKERMKRRFITPHPPPNTCTRKQTQTRTHTAESGLIISSSPSLGGSEGLQAPLWGCWCLPFHSSHTWSMCPHTHARTHACWSCTHTYRHLVFLQRQHNWKNTVTVEDGGAAVLSELQLPEHELLKQQFWTARLKCGMTSSG